MDKFLNLLEQQGIKKNIMDVLHKDNGADIQSILEYEIQKDENLEDAFLQFAHEFGMKVICDRLEHEFVVEEVRIPLEAIDKALTEFAVKISEIFNKKTER